MEIVLLAFVEIEPGTHPLVQQLVIRGMIILPAHHSPLCLFQWERSFQAEGRSASKRRRPSEHAWNALSYRCSLRCQDGTLRLHGRRQAYYRVRVIQ